MDETAKGGADVLIQVQTSIQAPKSQHNQFGNFDYRSCEDILEALKPLQEELGFLVLLRDELMVLREQFVVKAIATFIHPKSGFEVSNTAYARMEDTKKGMDLMQLTGAASSYARKYALAGLFALDDNRDSDSQTKTANELQIAAARQMEEDDDPIGIYLMSKRVGPDVWTSIFNSGEKGKKVHFKTRLREMEATGAALVQNIVMALETQDDLALKENLEGISSMGLTALKKMLDKDQADHVQHIHNEMTKEA